MSETKPDGDPKDEVTGRVVSRHDANPPPTKLPDPSPAPATPESGDKHALAAYLEEYKSVRDEILMAERLLFGAFPVYSVALLTVAGWLVSRVLTQPSEASQSGATVAIVSALETELSFRLLFYMGPLLGSLVTFTVTMLAFSIWKAGNYLHRDLAERIRSAGAAGFEGFGWEDLQRRSPLLLLANALPVVLAQLIVLAISFALLYMTREAPTHGTEEEILRLIGLLATSASLLFGLFAAVGALVLEKRAR